MVMHATVIEYRDTQFSMSLRTITQSPNAITVKDPYIIFYNKPALDLPMFWHKFIIKDVYGLHRNAFLKIFLDFLSPLEFIPLCYTEENAGAYFFARICGPVIEKLSINRLKVPNPLNKDNPFEVSLVLKYSSTNTVKLDITPNLLSVLNKRLKGTTLCLTNFCEDPELEEFFLLSQPKLFAFVLNTCKAVKMMTNLKLDRNDISTLEPFYITVSPNLVSLDLRENQIKDMSELKYLTHLKLTELWLEGNPVCELLDEYTYVQQVLQYCPKLEKLDGYLLRQNGIPSFRRNFLCKTEAYGVVDKFLQDFFTAYDCRISPILGDCYHEDALFSMTADCFQEQSSSYKLHSRNLRLNGEIRTLHTGRSRIMALFGLLPRSEHDPYSFTVDVLHYTDKCLVLVVTGVFREVPKMERVLSFNRHFVLQKRDSNFKISNEQLHVFNAVTSQQVSAFKKQNMNLYEAKDAVQRHQMINTFVLITNLSKDWAKIFLEECHFNFKNAILLFVDLYKRDLIPDESFEVVQ